MVEPAGHGLDAEHVRKWLHREPEMGVVLRFVPRTRRDAFIHWGVVLSELREAAFELSEPRVAAAKTTWWAEELLRIDAGEGRHPLGRGIRPGLGWMPVAQSLVELADRPERVSTPEQAWAGVARLSHALARVELEWFGDDAAAEAVAADALQVHLLGQRLLLGRESEDGARIPMSLLARHGCVPADIGQEAGAPVVADWSGFLLQRAPARLPGASVFRRLRAGLDREQLAHLQRGSSRTWRPGLASVVNAWRIARRPD